MKKILYKNDGIEFDVEYTVDDYSRKWSTTTLKITPINDSSMLRIKFKHNGKEYQTESTEFVEVEVYGNNENTDVQSALKTIFNDSDFSHL